MLSAAVSGKRKDRKDDNAKRKRSKNAVNHIHQPRTMELPILISSEDNHQWSLRCEDSSNFILPQISSSEASFKARISEAFDTAAGKPFSKENLKKAKKWLHFRGLVVPEDTESEPSLGQQIVQCLRGEVSHGLYLCAPDGSTVVPKGLLLLVAIARYYAIEITVFSTRSKPIVIAPEADRDHHTAALLRHQDSILSVGEWHPLCPAKNWVKQAPTIHAGHTAAMISPPAVKRPEGAAPKRSRRGDYKSIGDDKLKGSLFAVW
jgi:hypothetical protein